MVDQGHVGRVQLEDLPVFGQGGFGRGLGLEGLGQGIMQGQGIRLEGDAGL